MVRQVGVDCAWSNWSCPDVGERAESARVVERGDLGDHPANTDARYVRRPGVEFAGERRRVGGQIAQRVVRSLGIDTPASRRSYRTT